MQELVQECIGSGKSRRDVVLIEGNDLRFQAGAQCVSWVEAKVRRLYLCC